ncbi:hypothetical protein PACTADRAFT_51170 [Pachysolen tannophilus NRRL Y-2460]|uniref:Uncharacterized protein n=1 Tax=Pachysolen tannophilus NRRL Y-2460 TaxID=669874 RepID=A0A1E4TRC1_PACTA|nr:hypothetical protein PACTADRAFT_51170 [Pachysolen tannophilus NRRL Y-2460]
MSAVPSPDELVDYIIEELIINFPDGAKLDNVWEIVSNRIISLNNVFKMIIWTYLMKNREINVFESNRLLARETDFNYILNQKQDIIIKISEEKRWLFLTNMPKTGNPIGSNPFDLLSIIIKKKNEGITGSELAKASGQDPRSFTSRLDTLISQDLIVKIPIIRPGVTTNLLVHKRFFDEKWFEENREAQIVNRPAILKSIVEAVKDSKNKLRVQYDLGRQLGFTSKQDLKRFRKLIVSLVENGFLKIVYVMPSENSQVKARALMYVKDYDAQDNLQNDGEEISSDEQQDAVDDEDEDEDEDSEEKFSNDKQDPVPSMNQLFTLDSQIMQAVAKSGNKGITSMELTKNLTGSNNKWFSRYFSSLPFSDAGNENSANPIFRVTDSDGKSKFFRYYLNSSLLGEFSKQDFSDDCSLVELSLQNYKPIGNTIDIVKCGDGIERVYWGGIKDPVLKKETQHLLKRNDAKTSNFAVVIDNTNETVGSIDEQIGKGDSGAISDDNKSVKKRGRPRKSNVAEAPIAEEEPSQKKKKQAPSEDSSSPTANEENYNPASIDATLQNDNPELNNSETDLTATSSLAPTPKPTALRLKGIFSTNPRISESHFAKNPSVTNPRDLLSNSKEFSMSFDGYRGNLKSIQRQNEILKMLEENGGIVVADQGFRRELDNRINNAYSTDKKTLKRDSMVLVQKGEIETLSTKLVSNRTGEVTTNKTLFISTNNTPSDEEIKSFIDKLNIREYKTSRAVLENPTLIQPDLEFLMTPIPRAFDKNPPKRARLSKISPSKKLQELTTKNDKAESLVAPTASSHQVKRQAKSIGKPNKFNKAPVQDAVQETENKTLKLNKAEEGEHIDPLLSYLSTTKGKRRKQFKKKERNSNEMSQVGITRQRKATIQFTADDIMLAIKAVVISKSLAPYNSIEWIKIAKLFNYPRSEHEKFRKKWPTIRKSVGSKTIAKVSSAWEIFLTNSIKKGIVTLEDLQDVDLEHMIDLWKNSESFYLDKDSISLFADIDDNYSQYSFTVEPVEEIDFSKESSMIEREHILASLTFTLPLKAEIQKDDPITETKVAVKAMFASPRSEFNSKKSKTILEQLGDSNCRQVLKQLEEAKEIVYLGEDSDIKFTLSDRVYQLLENKIDENFLIGASSFHRAICSVTENSKGMILSQVTPDYTIPPLLHLLFSDKIKLIRIDKSMENLFDSYVSRNIDKEKLDCDFIIAKGNKHVEEFPLNEIALPLGKPCSKIWIDMNGNINIELWKKIIATMIHNIYFRPNISSWVLFNTLKAVLSFPELKEILQWLITKKCVIENSHDCYSVHSDWYTVLG